MSLQKWTSSLLVTIEGVIQRSCHERSWRRIEEHILKCDLDGSNTLFSTKINRIDRRDRNT